jgi:hypothetical protein
MTKMFLALAATATLAFADAPATLTVTAAQLAPLGTTNLACIHVQDAAGKELVVQAVDTDFDAFHKYDLVIFQSDFATNETKTFTVSVGKKQEYSKEEFKAFGRFNRERFDDFAWENDRIAHRIYGKALETWEGEPLTSSTIDIWSKRTARMVGNDWYLADHYHHDTGEGADFYSAGKTRGCGGNGIWAADKLWVSKNFTASRTLAAGPIRVLFELDYDAFDANGVKVSETKRISLDAGSQLDHLQSLYKSDAPGALTCGIGLRKLPGEQVDFNAANGTLLAWQKMEKNAGQQGVALLVNPQSVGQTEDKLNHLLLTKCDAHNAVSYWAGFAWDKAGQIPDAPAWKKYVDEFAQGLASPIEVSVK